MRKSLKISPTPFKSSFLSIPPSPFSPRTPFTPTVPYRHQTQNRSQEVSPTPKPANSAPPSPLQWTWTCHHCHSNYGLSVTRRCLEDGHYYCNGPTTIRAWREPQNVKRSRKRGSCSSEFDYTGWKEWSRWRRGGPRDKAAMHTNSPTVDEGKPSKQKKKDCWNMCDYPSECKWGNKFGIHTPVATNFPVPEVDTMTTLNAPVKTTSEGILKPENYKEIKGSNKDGTFGLWAALLASAERRKNSRGRAPSPLSAVTEDHMATARNDNITSSPQDNEGDTSIAATDSPESSDASVSDSSLEEVGMSKPLLSRRRYRRRRPSSTTHGTGKVKSVESRFSLNVDR